MCEVNLEECRCACHPEISKQDFPYKSHIGACCTTCAVCGKRVLNGPVHAQQHFYEFRAKFDELFPTDKLAERMRVECELREDVRQLEDARIEENPNA